MYKLRFRQIHLDFHTSEMINNIGSKFDKKQFQKALKLGHVNSITCFAKCHHGWSYHPTRAGKKHPNLEIDLLRAQYQAAKEIGINVPIYLSAGLDNVISREHPEWREVDFKGQKRPRAFEAGFCKMCFNSPYISYLCEQILEVVNLFPDCDGIFLDIIKQGQCCCNFCREVMKQNNFDVNIESDRNKCSQIALKRYYEKSTIACKSLKKDMPVFHNSGHIQIGNNKIFKYFSHLELESLPTGGWGYDHFPISAKYCMTLPFDLMGMTGKFHTNWGEFGGFKHPNALKYECALMLAHGAKCSVGDQMHPTGQMDISSYKIIGTAYQEVQSKEPWCDNVENIADIGLLSSSSVNTIQQNGTRNNSADTGAARILLEGHFLFDVLDMEADFSKYKVLVLPDNILIKDSVKVKLDEYISKGGKLFLTGTSILTGDGNGFIFDIGANYHGQSEYQPDYILPNKKIRPFFVDSPLVMYLPSQRIKVTTGQSLGQVHDPFFNRTCEHFCSHQHAPAKPLHSGFDCGVYKDNIVYLAHPVFSIYHALGAVAYKEYIVNSLNLLLEQPTVKVNLPSTGRITLMNQRKYNRYILHLLYVNIINRGSTTALSCGTISDKAQSIEVIDELVPFYNIQVSVKVPAPVRKLLCVPEGKKLHFKQRCDIVEFILPELQCHQMVELAFA